jgi:hypothetical protein
MTAFALINVAVYSTLTPPSPKRLWRVGDLTLPAYSAEVASGYVGRASKGEGIYLGYFKYL